MVIVCFALDVMFQAEWLEAWNRADDEHMEDVQHGRDWKYAM